MWWTLIIGVTTFLTGFLLWVIDNEHCDFLRSIRHQIGIPWAFLLGKLCRVIATNSRISWMVVRNSPFLFSSTRFNLSRHILTGLGVYYYIQFLLYLRLCLEGNRTRFNFMWVFGLFPRVERRCISVKNGSINGVTHFKKD